MVHISSSIITVGGEHPVCLAKVSWFGQGKWVEVPALECRAARTVSGGSTYHLTVSGLAPETEYNFRVFSSVAHSLFHRTPTQQRPALRSSNCGIPVSWFLYGLVVCRVKNMLMASPLAYLVGGWRLQVGNKVLRGDLQLPVACKTKTRPHALNAPICVERCWSAIHPQQWML
eukprot:5148170-Amphidinium_carterae.1